MPEIKITVKNKVATAEHGAKFVCGNSDYTIKFDFDEEWSGHNFKTALFVFKGQLVPVAFDGNECEAPIIRKATLLGIGVKASDGELKTTTPAYIPCELSAEDIAEEEIEEPTPSVYDEIIELINAGMVKGEQGEKGEKGDKGDAGAIKFMAVTSLPTENIATDAIYLLPMPDGMGDNTFAEYVYIDGKWEVLGSVALNVDHSEYVKFTDYATESKAGVVRVATHRGMAINVGNGLVELKPASETELKARAWYMPVTAGNLDTALKVGVTTNTLPLTDEEKASACDWIGAVPKWKPAADGSTTLIGLAAGGTYYAYNLTFGIPRNNAIPCYVGRGTGNNVLGTGTPELDTDCTNKKYVDDLVGDIESVLDSVIALQNSLIGGNV